MLTGNPTDLPAFVSFYDNYIPSLQGGRYTIELSQALTVDVAQTTAAGGNPAIPAEPAPAARQTFEVRAPRFATLLPTDVSQQFPPAGSTGDFQAYLPQLVLRQQALPWERPLALPAAKCPPGKTAAEVPWVALLVFTEGELTPLLGAPKTPTRTSTITLAELQKPDEHRLGPQLTLESDQLPEHTCHVIELSAKTFNELMPSLNDLRYLAHVRQVDVQHKALVPGQDGWFGAVVANRFAGPPTAPETPLTYIAHLVSLEGFEEHLQLDGPPAVSGYHTVRMVSLYSWTYTTDARNPNENFGPVMLNLVSAAAEQGAGQLLRLPNPPAPAAAEAPAQAVHTRLHAGYAPLGYAMLSGDQTFGWYRGPFSPVPVPHFMGREAGPVPGPVVPTTTAQAMIFEPATGLFDQSYAVAFQTGRSLALASQSFATSLLNWRRSAHHAVDCLHEQLHSPLQAARPRHGQLLHADGTLTAGLGVAELAQLLNPRAATEAFQEFMTTTFQEELVLQIGQPGGYIRADRALQTPPAPTRLLATEGPASLPGLLAQPVVGKLLEHLAGLDDLGQLAQPLEPGATTLVLTARGTTERLYKGMRLVLGSPAGSISGWLTVAADAAAGAAHVTIKPYTSPVTLPAGSTLHAGNASEDAAQVAQWLADTALLYGVPFNNLVAHPSLLPLESVRFFYLDPNWLDALLDGALSIGLQTSRDTAVQQLLRPRLYARVRGTVVQARGLRLGLGAGAPAAAPPAPAGFLLRSQALVGWPGLDIQAWAAGADRPMTPLRLDALASGVLLALFPDVPVRVSFTEPSEGLAFGTEPEGITLRNLPGLPGCDATNVGQALPRVVSPAQLATARRPAAPDAHPALNVAGPAGLVQLLQSQLPGAPAGFTLSPAALAVQMVRVPERLLFSSPSLSSPQPQS